MMTKQKKEKTNTNANNSKRLKQKNKIKRKRKQILRPKDDEKLNEFDDMEKQLHAQQTKIKGYEKIIKQLKQENDRKDKELNAAKKDKIMNEERMNQEMHTLIQENELLEEQLNDYGEMY